MARLLPPLLSAGRGRGRAGVAAPQPRGRARLCPGLCRGHGPAWPPPPSALELLIFLSEPPSGLADTTLYLSSWHGKSPGIPVESPEHHAGAGGCHLWVSVAFGVTGSLLCGLFHEFSLLLENITFFFSPS